MTDAASLTVHADPLLSGDLLRRAIPRRLYDAVEDMPIVSPYERGPDQSQVVEHRLGEDDASETPVRPITRRTRSEHSSRER